MTESKIPKVFLTVLLRDVTPLILFNDPPKNRTVKIELTNDQLKRISLKYVGKNNGSDIFEEISECFLEEDQQCSNIPYLIDDLELTGRTINCLKSQSIFCVSDLLKLSSYDILSFNNMGYKSLKEIKMVLSHHGLHLEDDKK